MLIIGITGGIGSGKSYVAKLFALMGAVVYRSDDAAKRVMVENSELVLSIKELLGEEAYGVNGELNRAFIANKIFSSMELREALNSVVHPAVERDFCDFCSKSNADIIIHESAILFESGFNKFVNIVVAVTAKEESRVERVVSRDGCSVEDVLRRVASQMLDSERNKLADYIIDNNDNVLLMPQIIKVLELECKNITKNS